MQYRDLGKTGMKVSALGFGLMRLPVKDDHIDTVETEKMIFYAMEKGINYFDTAWPYHNGESEITFGELVPGDIRKKIYLTTKMPIWLVEKYEDFDKYLDEQLGRLQTDYLDTYLIHAIYSQRWEAVLKFKAIEWLESAKKDGRIRNFGFSFHDSTDLFKTVLDAYEGWDLVQIQYNYLNEKVQAGTEGLNYAAQKKTGIVIMEPLYGGLLANPPETVKALFQEHNKKPVEMALDWIWNRPEVSCLLSGMSSFNQLKENITLAEKSAPGKMGVEDLAVIKEAEQLYFEANPISCTRCRYCLPCPQGVDIPRNFELYNEGVGRRALQLNKSLYSFHMKPEHKASNCIACGECLPKCPQNIPITEWMPRIDKEMSIAE